ncbi:DUF2019 domain-containing protein [Mangrovicella endophytica]|uniref:DUF2019 domain-containing protein n=1 Tax=Mangrovicella endophytica TaxID=2066697 RepID=UPI000C9E9CC5|nr:DUF2019 domain-containing protein [Mangrovicella endophytica]
MTTRKSLSVASIDEIVSEYISIGLAEAAAIEDDDNRRFNRLATRLFALTAELKRRDGDQRRALVSLLKHDNAQVRLNAAHATLVVAPREAREQLEMIARYEAGHQALAAGMALTMLNDGRYVPA